MVMKPEQYVRMSRRSVYSRKTLRIRPDTESRYSDVLLEISMAGAQNKRWQNCKKQRTGSLLERNKGTPRKRCLNNLTDDLRTTIGEEKLEIVQIGRRSSQRLKHTPGCEAIRRRRPFISPAITVLQETGLQCLIKCIRSSLSVELYYLLCRFLEI